MLLQELLQDQEFRQRWPHVWAKLEPFFIEKMISYAGEHKGQYEKVGQFAEFMAEIINDFKILDGEYHTEVKKRPRLHNTDLK